MHQHIANSLNVQTYLAIKLFLFCSVGSRPPSRVSSWMCRARICQVKSEIAYECDCVVLCELQANILTVFKITFSKWDPNRGC